MIFFEPTLAVMEFQPTSPRGERLLYPKISCDVATISTHVPARGTTNRPIRLGSAIVNFNPRPREGNDRRTGKVYQTKL